jgi:hypothetical protein
MVWDGMTREEQVIAQTEIHQEATNFLEEFGTRLQGAQPRGSKSHRRSENGSGGDFTRRKDWYRLNDIRTVAYGQNMEIWVPRQVLPQR